ncbi:MAG: LysR substrate-binding domain-containing protein, partial [Cypionkella sp.]
LSVLPEFLVSEDVKSGALRHVLPDWHLPAGGIYTVFPAARFRPTKVAVFVEMLIASLHKQALTRSGPGSWL